MPSSDSRGAVIALIGGLLGAVIGAGSSYATATLSSSSENTRFAYTQERTAYAQVATTADALRSAAARLLDARNAEDPAAFDAARTAAEADFLRFTQAYNEAFFVLADTGDLVSLYDAALQLRPELSFEDYDPQERDAALDAYDQRILDLLDSAREQVRARLRETE